MDIKVVLKNNFAYICVSNYEIYSFGINPCELINSVDDISKLISQIKNLSKQYAIIITKNSQLYFACVDHLASIPLYYSSNLITDSWKTIDDNSVNYQTNWITIVEDFLLGGQNINDNTQYKQVLRILPGNYLFENTQHSYKNLMHFSPLNDNLKDMIIKKFQQSEKDHNVLMFSGGTDSVFLLNLVQNYSNKNWRIIHMYSDQEINNELTVAKYVENWYKCKIEKHNLDQYVNLTTTQKDRILEQNSRVTFTNYWHHEEMLPKLMLLNMANVLSTELIWTGEVGDQLFGGPKLSSLLPTLIQQKNVEAIANLWIDLSCSYNASYITDISKHEFFNRMFQTPVKGRVWKLAYDKLINEISNIFYQSDVNDLILKFIHMNYLIKGQFRLWPYSQLPEYTFYHIFAEYDIARYVFNSSSDIITPAGMLKGCLLNLFKEELPDYVWKLPKAGPTMPTDRLRQRFIG